MDTGPSTFLMDFSLPHLITRRYIISHISILNTISNHGQLTHCETMKKPSIHHLYTIDTPLHHHLFVFFFRLRRLRPLFLGMTSTLRNWSWSSARGVDPSVLDVNGRTCLEASPQGKAVDHEAVLIMGTRVVIMRTFYQYIIQLIHVVHISVLCCM